MQQLQVAITLTLTTTQYSAMSFDKLSSQVDAKVSIVMDKTRKWPLAEVVSHTEGL
jgi:hypothetical protein